MARTWNQIAAICPTLVHTPKASFNDLTISHVEKSLTLSSRNMSCLHITLFHLHPIAINYYDQFMHRQLMFFSFSMNLILTLVEAISSLVFYQSGMLYQVKHLGVEAKMDSHKQTHLVEGCQDLNRYIVSHLMLDII